MENTCKHCGSTKIHKNGREKNGTQKYHCQGCGSFSPFSNNSVNVQVRPSVPRAKHGIHITEFRKKHDVDFIVKEVLDSLNPEFLYEKKDIIEMTGLRTNYPRLNQTILAFTEYYGKAGSVEYWSSPKTIEELTKETILT